MLRFANELTVAATGFDDATRITALVDGALALRFQGHNVDATTRLREAWVEVHRYVLPQSVLEVGAALASVALSMALLDEADTVARECLALDTRLAGFQSARSFSLVLPHLVELSRGNWRDAVEGLHASAARESEPHYRQHAHRERATALARLDPAHAASEVRDAVGATLADAEIAAAGAASPKPSAGAPRLSPVSSKPMPPEPCSTARSSRRPMPTTASGDSARSRLWRWHQATRPRRARTRRSDR